MRLDILFRVLLVLWVSTIAHSAKGQIRIRTSQYFLSKLALNPAYAGVSDRIELVTLYRNQYENIRGGPMKFLLQYATPISNTNSSIGASIDYDKMGPLRQYEVCASYSYRIRMDLNKSLGFGLRGGVVHGEFNPTELDGYSLNDPRITATNQLFTLPVFGGGAYYESKKLAMGLSVPNFLVNDFTLTADSTDFKSEFKTFAMGEYLFNINDKIALKPSCFIRYQPKSQSGLDLNLYFIYQKKYWLGLGFQSEDLMSLNLLFILDKTNFQFLNNSIRIGYSYEFNRTSYKTYLGGAHEIVLGFLFKRKFAREKVIPINPRTF